MSNKHARKGKLRTSSGKIHASKVPKTDNCFGWKHSQKSDKLRWWDAGRSAKGEWRNLLVMFGLIMLLVAGLPMLAVELIGLVLGQGSTLFSGRRTSGDADLMPYVLLGFGLAAGTIACLKSIRKKPIAAFEFDLAAETVLLQEACFPDRRRDMLVPFSAVTSLCIEKSCGTWHSLTLGYLAEDGTSRSVSLGFDLPINVLESHMARLTAQLGKVMQPMMEYVD